MRKMEFSKTTDGKVNLFADGKLIKGAELNLSQVKAAKKAFQFSPALQDMLLKRIASTLANDGFSAVEVAIVVAQYKTEVVDA